MKSLFLLALGVALSILVVVFAWALVVSHFPEATSHLSARRERSEP